MNGICLVPGGIWLDSTWNLADSTWIPVGF